RVVTYNAHGCVGVDSKLSPARIARVLSRHRPNIVALQEIDVGRERSGGIDQASKIAELLRMNYHFFPVVEEGEEKYGLAVLSFFPIREVKTGWLPGLIDKPKLEPRGAQWLELDCGGEKIQLVNTHLGLRKLERRQQVRALLGEEWLGKLPDDEPVIICGDMNALPFSYVHTEISGRFPDVQILTREQRPRRTLYGRYPLGRIDHIFVSPHFEVRRVEVARTTLARVASDHLPVFTELKLPEPVSGSAS
ncbi:MAG TPA: endonuclease/exonuclease/phosphatase family protein, partial [Opitutales bacterium]|nr:endonuclease/exonuclease/phosphatase family protein [Opitutales bacterium]